MLARTDSRARAVVLLLVVAVAASAIGARLVWWQVVQQASLSASALGQLSQQEELPAERGEITDINGALLATSIELQSVFATPPLIADPAQTATAPCPGPRHLDRPAAREAGRRPRLGLAEAKDHARGRRAHPIPRPAWHRHAPRDEAGLPDRRVSPRARRWRPRCSASSTSTGMASTASRVARTRSWRGRPARSARRRTSSAARSPTRRPCSGSRSTGPTCA